MAHKKPISIEWNHGKNLPRVVHFIGICGRMVGGLALSLKKLGVKVTGSDGSPFQPMPGLLNDAGILVNMGCAASNVPDAVEAVVTGAQIFRGNPELEEALMRGLPVWNATAFLEEYFLRDSENFVVAGTKGKTTTTAMLVWILEVSGRHPDFLIGGQVRNGLLPRVRLQNSSLKVLEGDEYRCGQGDPFPKFLRYRPRHVAITNIGHDHLEIYPTRHNYCDAFINLIARLPFNGTLTINADDPFIARMAGMTPTPTKSVGFSRKADFRLTSYRESTRGISFKLGSTDFKLCLHGRTNALDAALASVIAGHAGVSLHKAARALCDFPGVEGRFEKIAAVGRTVVYADEAYLPIAISPLLMTLRKRHPRRRLVMVFEPRYTGGRDAFCQEELPGCLANADRVIIAPSIEVTVDKKPFDHKLLCRDLRKAGVEATAVNNLDDVINQVLKLHSDGDIIMVSLAMNRSEVTQKLVRALKQTIGTRGTCE